jgi:hypothetical protein
VDLDERGIVRIGAHVVPGDILVGKITPKGETELSPEEKLLTAIFGEKAKDVKDSSLKVPPGMAGVVIDVKIFSRVEDQVVEKDRGERIGEVRRLENEEKARISAVLIDELRDLLDGQDVVADAAERHRRGVRCPRAPRSPTKRCSPGSDFGDVDLKTFRVKSKDGERAGAGALDAAGGERAKIEEKAEDQIDKILQPDELPPGVIQLVKVYLAEKRKISVGDKMAGRHGNKGIVARIVPEEDMPFLPDGTPVDIVLNPLGVPSRMNVGQLLETHLGWAARILGFEAKTPVFQGASEAEIAVLLRLSSLVWARDAMRIPAPAPVLSPDAIRRLLDDLKRLPGEQGDAQLGSFRVDTLASRAVSQETRDLFHATRDFLEAAARALGERHRTEAATQVADHEGRLADEALGKTEKAALKAGLREAEKRAALSVADAVTAAGLPALAAMLGPKSEADVEAALREFLLAAGLTPTGKMHLRDGRSGDAFTSDVTVGAVYMLKLSHLVDDKIHARSIGPYSPRHAAAAGRQGAVRRPAVRRDGGVGARGVRRRARPAGNAHGQVRRRERTEPRLRGDREGPEPAGTRASRSRSTCSSRNSRRSACGSRWARHRGRRGVRGSATMIDFRSTREPRGSAFDYIQIRIASPEEIRGPKRFQGAGAAGPAGTAVLVVVGRGDQARDHQLPVVQAREGRAVLRAHLRSGQGLGVPLRQVQADPLPRRDLRPLRRGGDALEGAARAHGAHRAGRAGGAHLVLQDAAVARWATCSTHAQVTSSG